MIFELYLLTVMCIVIVVCERVNVCCFEHLFVFYEMELFVRSILCDLIFTVFTLAM